MFQINWKLKALLYKVFETFKLNKTLYFVQRHITGRAKIQFTKLDLIGKGTQNQYRKKIVTQSLKLELENH